MKAFATGLAIGIAVGWGAALVLRPSADDSPPAPPAPPERAPVAVGDPSPASRLRGDRPRVEPPSEERLDDRAPILTTGDAEAVRRAMSAPRQLSDPELSAAAQRLVQARDAGDATVFFAVLQALGTSKDVRARAKAVDVLGDPEFPLVSLKTGIFGDIARWLERGAVPPGVGAASRRRFAANEAAGNVKVGADALLSMAVRHGDADDLAWVAAMTDSRPVGREAMQALMRTSRAETAPIVVKLVADRRIDGDDLLEYARSNPHEAWTIVSSMIDAIASGNGPPPGIQAGLVFAAYGVAAPESALDEIRRRLVGLPTPELRITAIETVSTLDDRRLDVTAFAPILDAPLDLLAAPGEIESDRGHTCMYAIQYHKILWIARAADVLEAAAPRAGALGSSFRDVAREIRQHLADPWRRK